MNAVNLGDRQDDEQDDELSSSDLSDDVSLTLAREIQEIIEELPVPDEKKPIIRSVVKKIEALQYSGPIPPPSLLAGYEKLLPGSADRILRMAENEQINRHKLENGDQQLSSHQIANSHKIQLIDRRLQLYGLMAGFTLALFILVGSVVIIVNGYELAGLASMVAAMVGLIAVFYRSTALRAEKPEPKDD